MNLMKYFNHHTFFVLKTNSRLGFFCYSYQLLKQLTRRNLKTIFAINANVILGVSKVILLELRPYQVTKLGRKYF